jgi:hypothetical protein
MNRTVRMAWALAPIAIVVTVVAVVWPTPRTPVPESCPAVPVHLAPDTTTTRTTVDPTATP